MHAAMIRKLAKSNPAKLKTETTIWQLDRAQPGLIRSVDSQVVPGAFYEDGAIGRGAGLFHAA